MHRRWGRPGMQGSDVLENCGCECLQHDVRRVGDNPSSESNGGRWELIGTRKSTSLESECTHGWVAGACVEGAEAFLHVEGIPNWML